MKILPFDESLKQRDIKPYDPVYADLFLRIKAHAESRIDTVELFHIGSTAIPELRGKPMLDIAAVTTRPDLRAAQREFEALGFHRRDVWVDYNINIHICHRNDSVHQDSLAFMEILNRRPDLRRKYEQAKERAHAIDPVNPEIYNREKDAVIREIHDEALARGGRRSDE